MHRNFEKMAEERTYWQIIPYTDRLNYCSSFMNGHGWALAVEKLLGVPAPPRAEADPRDPVRVLADHGPLRLHRHQRRGPGRDHALLRAVPRARGHLRRCSRPAAARASPSPTCASAAWPQDVPDDFVARCRDLVKRVDDVHRPGGQAPDPQRDLREPLQGRGRVLRGRRALLRLGGPVPARVRRRLRRPQGPSLLRLRAVRLRRAGAAPSATATTATSCAWRRSARACASSTRRCAKLPEGPCIVDDKRVALPPKSDVYSNIEALMNHFKLVYEGILPPAGRGLRLHRRRERRAGLLHRERRARSTPRA